MFKTKPQEEKNANLIFYDDRGEEVEYHPIRATVKHTANDWDKYFLEIAEVVSRQSKDPSTKVGAVIVDEDRRVISQGYNGFPQGIADTEERLNNREIKYKLVVHGEINAILFAGKTVKSCTLYTYPFMCCSACALLVIQSGIKRVVAPFSDNPRWIESFKLTRELFKELAWN